MTGRAMYAVGQFDVTTKERTRRLESHLASEDLNGSHLERLEDCPEFDREFYVIVEDNNA
jgi:hypothetical protein